MTLSFGICLLNRVPYLFPTPGIKEWIHESFKNHEIMILDGQMKDMYCHDLNTFSKITVESLIQRPWKVNHHRKHIVHEGTMYVDTKMKREWKSQYIVGIFLPLKNSPLKDPFLKKSEKSLNRDFSAALILCYIPYISVREMNLEITHCHGVCYKSKTDQGRIETKAMK